MAEIKLDEGVFVTNRLNATEQFHVFIKLAPLISSFIKLRLTIRTARKAAETDDERRLKLGENIDALARALSQTPKADVDFILSTCLMACQKRVGGGLAQVWVLNGGLSDQGLSLLTMLRLVWEVLEENLSSFFESAALILGSLAAGEKPT